MNDWKQKTNGWLHDDKNIRGFFGDYRWLSNFEPCIVEYEGLVYPSSEAAYQAAKCEIKAHRERFLMIDAARAKSLGRLIIIRKDWNEIKLQVMQDILVSKFNKNSYLRNQLIATGNKFLEETNWWHDIFWGVCNNKGENNLGKVLMKIRESMIA